ncbi:uncharacterized protein LOC34624013 [Cyclospora cayetanensis]|uniref:Uncharacterized protein LOC34624013 n=1 Tax=Cyclospora cayetanensis TaxID=88456 RepID=A0A6P6RU95_9EIME|nr:uncharacterized protein LOC34624013 [Cyclospora cayetanensis]
MERSRRESDLVALARYRRQFRLEAGEMDELKLRNRSQKKEELRLVAEPNLLKRKISEIDPENQKVARNAAQLLEEAASRWQHGNEQQQREKNELKAACAAFKQLLSETQKRLQEAELSLYAMKQEQEHLQIMNQRKTPSAEIMQEVIGNQEWISRECALLKSALDGISHAWHLGPYALELSLLKLEAQLEWYKGESEAAKGELTSVQTLIGEANTGSNKLEVSLVGHVFSLAAVSTSATRPLGIA